MTDQLDDLTGVLVVVPSISRNRIEAAASGWLRSLQSHGATCVVVANNVNVLDTKVPDGVQVVSSRQNSGFAASVNFGAAASTDWRVLLICNDDLDIPDPALGLLVTALGDLVPEADQPQLISFDPEPARRVPTPADVFLNISLLEAVLRRVADRRGSKNEKRLDREVTPVGWYHSFSIVSITRGMWRTIGGLDERYGFCYEDAAYCAEIHRRVAGAAFHQDCGIHHGHSVSSGRYIDKVLPVIVSSALQYLQASGKGRVQASLILAAALFLRIALAAFGRTPLRRHVVGILRGFRQILPNPVAAALPNFKTPI